MEIKPWKILKSETAFKNRYWNILQETVELPDGTAYSGFFVNDRPGGAMVFAVTEEGKVVMNRQYKHGVREIVTEFAIGGLGEGEDPLLAAQRELMEETGYGGGAWEPLGVFSPNPTTARGRFHAFLAKGVRKVGDPLPDPREIIETFLADPKDVPGMVRRGEIASLAAVSIAFVALMRLEALDSGA